MVEVAISVASKLAEYLVGPILRPFRYMWDYNTNFQKLEAQVRKINAQRERVHQSVVEGKRQGDDIFKHVQEWVDKAQKIVDDALKVLQQNNQANIKCLKGLCRNPYKLYQHSRKAAKKVEAVAKLYEEGNFTTVSYRTIPKETWIPSYKGYEAFESRASVLENVLNALKKPDVNMVGIYGTGGIGKTTLARAVAKHAEDNKLFNFVAFAEVSTEPDIKEIQKEFADKLGLTFVEESTSGRAMKLQQILQQEFKGKEVDGKEVPSKSRKALLILDNIWGKLDLEKVGIPFGTDNKGCKLLLTARSQDVLNEMHSANNFCVHGLKEEEAWGLFKKTAGDCVNHPDLKSLAPQVAKLCGGLPIAIVCTASALKDKEVYEWRNALNELRAPSEGNFEGVAAEAYKCIELSYNQLKGEQLKSTFLLCGILLNSTDATVRDLLNHGMALSIFVGINTMEDAIDRVNTLLRKLKDSSLLLDTGIKGSFSMHDVVRNVAKSIALRDHQMLTVTDGEIPRSFQDGFLQNCTTICLRGVTELPNDELKYSKLQFLYMKLNDPSMEIPNDFFAGMTELRVLDLIEVTFSSLPISLSRLVHIQTLTLKKCMLEDVAIVGNLKTLEILSFAGSVFEKLPEQIGQLTRLRSLDLHECSELEVIPPKVLSNLTRLEELLMGNTFNTQWDIEGQSSGTSVSLNELMHLPRLTTLEIRINDDKMLPKGFFLEKLNRYVIVLGSQWYDERAGLHETTRTVKLELNNTGCFEHEFISRLKGIRKLCIANTQGVKSNVVYKLDTEGFPELNRLEVKENDKILYIVHSSDLARRDAFSILESLHLSVLHKLEKICDGRLRAESFGNLRSIDITACSKLKNVFSFSTDRGLPHLERISVSYCKDMEEIFSDGSKEDVSSDEVMVDQIEFTQLREVTLKYLPKLTCFYSELKTSPSQNRLPLFSQKVVMPNLEILVINKIYSERLWPSQFLSIQNLTMLIVTRCHELKYIFSSSMVGNFVNLVHLETEDCKNLEEIVAMDDLGERKDIILPHLMSLDMENLANLTRFCSGCYIKLPSLTYLSIFECPKMEAFNMLDDEEAEETESREEIQDHSHDEKVEKSKSLNDIQPFFNEMVAFPSLEEIDFSEVNNFEILSDQLDKDSFGRLKRVTLLSCDYLLVVFPSSTIRKFSRLEEVEVSSCDSLEVIFDLQGINFEENHCSTTIDLIKLQIDCLPELKHIWNEDPKGKISYRKLEKMTIEDCDILKNVFPMSIAESVLKLDYLSVTCCDEMEEIVGEEVGAEEAAMTLCFPHDLTYLRLSKLPKLRNFYPARWPALKRLELEDCYSVDICLQEDSEKSQVNQPLFLVPKNFPNLEELKLRGEYITSKWQDQFSEYFFRKLEYLEVTCHESTTFSFGWLSRFQNLKKLVLDRCSYQEIFSSGEVENPIRMISNLKNVQKQDSKFNHNLQNLECLELSGYDNLLTLMPSTAPLENLTSLKVEYCHGLINLFTSVTAKSLMRLTQLSIWTCQSMTEVVGDGEEVIEHENIVFSDLKTLSLIDLSSLTCFCPGNHTFNFPSLEELTVSRCPKMKKFCSGVLSTPRLHNLKLNYPENIKPGWKIDVNTAIQQLHEKKSSEPEELEQSSESEELEQSSETEELEQSSESESSE